MDTRAENVSKYCKMKKNVNIWHIFASGIHSVQDILKQISYSESTLQGRSFDTHQFMTIFF